MDDVRAIVRFLVEDCWSEAAAAARMRPYVGPDYIHHTLMGDWSFDEFVAGVAWVDDRLSNREYRVEHVIVEGEWVAALIAWSAIRREDGSLVEGRAAYHCRVIGGLVREDWDVFFPAP